VPKSKGILSRPKKTIRKPASGLSKPEGSYRHGHLRQALLQSALKLIEQRQDVSFTIRELSSVAGVSHSATYRHFKSKRTILAAIAVEGFQKLQQSLDSSLVDADIHSHSSLRALGEAYVNFARSNPQFFRVMFHPETKNVDDNPLLHAVSGKTFETLVQSISENQKLGRFIEGPPLELAMFAWSLVHGMATLYMNNNFKGPLSIALTESQYCIQKLTELAETGLLRKNLQR
jgi:AcrR family transcriptional regulator